MKLMSKFEVLLLRRILILFALLHIGVIVLIILPRRHTRSFRHALKHRFFDPLWAGLMRLFVIGSDVMWQEGNGDRGAD